IEFGKHSRRRDAVETIAVIEYSQFHSKTLKARGRRGFRQATQMNIRIAIARDAESLIEFNQAMALETEGKRLDPKKISGGVAAGNVCGFRLYVETENIHAQGVYDAVGMRRSHYIMFEEEV